MMWTGQTVLDEGDILPYDNACAQRKLLPCRRPDRRAKTGIMFGDHQGDALDAS